MRFGNEKIPRNERFWRTASAVSLASGILAIVVSAIGLAGWASWAPPPGNVAAESAPMRPNTALGVALGGTGLLLLSLKKPKAAFALAVPLGALGLATLFQYVSGVDLGIDGMFLAAPARNAEASGRPAPNTALCLLLFSLGLLCATGRLSVGRKGGWRLQMMEAAILGSIVAALGLNALFGYLGGVESAYGWGRWTRMARSTAAAFFVLGGGLFAFAWDRSALAQDRSPRWLAIPVGVGSALLAVSLWQTLLAEHVALTGASRAKAGLPEVALAMGLLMSAAMMLSVFFAQRLRLRAGELEEANASLVEEIAKVRREREEAERARRETARYVRRLQARNTELSEFAYVASHDLKAPLRAVSGYVQLLEKRLASKLGDEEREFLDASVENVQHMSRLIDDLLALSRVQRSKAPVSPISLDKPLDKVLSLLAPQVEAAEASIVRPAPLPTVLADETQMTQMFQNLIGNALKFRSGERPLEIAISAERAENEWKISVADNGIGFKPRYAQRVFEVFKRLHRSDEYPGTGMGLAICKKIAERHDGSISATASPGGGAVFVFSLPSSLKPEPENADAEFLDSLPGA